MEDDNFDCVLVHFVTPFFVDTESIAREIAEVSKQGKKPLVCNLMTDKRQWTGTLKILQDAGVPLFSLPKCGCKKPLVDLGYDIYGIPIQGEAWEEPEGIWTECLDQGIKGLVLLVSELEGQKGKKPGKIPKFLFLCLEARVSIGNYLGLALLRFFPVAGLGKGWAGRIVEPGVLLEGACKRRLGFSRVCASKGRIPGKKSSIRGDIGAPVCRGNLEG